jgi:hypothetical protein
MDLVLVSLRKTAYRITYDKWIFIWNCGFQIGEMLKWLNMKVKDIEISEVSRVWR